MGDGHRRECRRRLRRDHRVLGDPSWEEREDRAAAAPSARISTAFRDFAKWHLVPMASMNKVQAAKILIQVTA